MLVPQEKKHDLVGNMNLIHCNIVNLNSQIFLMFQEAAEGAKKFSEGCGRHGKNTGLFVIENNLEINEQAT